MKKVLFFFILSLGLNQGINAQTFTPVELSYDYKLVGTDEYEITVTFDLDNKWCAYSMTLPEDGPIPTTLAVSNSVNVEVVGSPKEKEGKNGKTVTGLDAMFGIVLTKYYKQAEFSVRIKVIDVTQPISFDLDLEYMTCDGEKCLAPQFVSTPKKLKEHVGKSK